MSFEFIEPSFLSEDLLGKIAVGHHGTPFCKADRRRSARLCRDTPLEGSLAQLTSTTPKRSSKASRSSTATAWAKRLAVTVKRSRKPTLPTRTKL